MTAIPQYQSSRGDLSVAHIFSDGTQWVVHAVYALAKEAIGAAVCTLWMLFHWPVARSFSDDLYDLSIAFDVTLLLKTYAWIMGPQGSTRLALNPIDEAVRKGSTDVLTYLLNCGVHSHSQSALKIAVELKRKDLLRILVQYPSEIPEDKFPLLQSACRQIHESNDTTMLVFLKKRSLLPHESRWESALREISNTTSQKAARAILQSESYQAQSPVRGNRQGICEFESALAEACRILKSDTEYKEPAHTAFKNSILKKPTAAKLIPNKALRDLWARIFHPDHREAHAIPEQDAKLIFAVINKAYQARLS